MKASDRVVDWNRNEDSMYDPIGVPPSQVPVDPALRQRMQKAGWNFGDEV